MTEHKIKCSRCRELLNINGLEDHAGKCPVYLEHLEKMTGVVTLEARIKSLEKNIEFILQVLHYTIAERKNETH